MNLSGRLSQSGYAVRTTIKTQYTAGILKLLSQPGCDRTLLRTPFMLRLFNNAQLRKGRAFTASQLQQMTHPEQTEHFQMLFQAACRYRLFVPVLALQCAVCGLEQHLSPDATADANICAGCLSPLLIPDDLSLSYILNPLLQIALKNGVLTVLLALWHYQETCSDEVIFQSHLAIEKMGQSGDIDLLVQCSDSLFIVECKDNLKTTPDAIAALDSQLSRLRQIADDIDANPVFATLYAENLPPHVTEILATYTITHCTIDYLLKQE